MCGQTVDLLSTLVGGGCRTNFEERLIKISYKMWTRIHDTKCTPLYVPDEF